MSGSRALGNPLAARLAAIALVATLTALAGCDLFVGATGHVKRGEAAMAAGDYRTATVEFKNALQSAPDNVDARLGLAESALALGDPLSAEKEVDRAQALKAPPERTETLKWRTALALGKNAEVATALASARLGLPESERTLMRAEAVGRLGRFDEAADLYKGLADAPKAPVEAVVGLGATLAARGQTDAALAEFSAALKATPGDVSALLARADTLKRTGKLEEADAAYREARDHADPKRNLPTYVTAEVGVAEMGLQLNRLEQVRAAYKDLKVNLPGGLVTRILGARLALSDGHPDAALDALTLVLRAQPDNPQALWLSGLAHGQRGQFAQAETDFQRLLRLRPKDAAVRRLLAEVELRQKRTDAARATLEADPGAEEDPATLLLMARVSTALGDRERAMKQLLRAQALAPDNAAVKLQLSAAYLAAGKSAEALALIGQLPGSLRDEYRVEMLKVSALPAAERDAEVKRFVATKPNEARSHLFAAFYLRTSGRLDEARAEVDAARTLAPADPLVLESSADLKAQAGELDAAEADLKALLKANPAAIRPRLALAEIAGKRGDAAQATAWLEEARMKDARAIEPRTLLARSEAEAGHVDAARAVAHEAVTIDPQRFDALAAAAYVEQRAGDSKKALEYATRAADANPHSADAWFLKGRLEAALGDAAAAKASLRKCVAIRPEWPAAVSSLAELLIRESDVAGARRLATDLKAKPGAHFEGLVLAADIDLSQKQYAAAASEYTEALSVKPATQAVLRRYEAQVRGGLAGAREGLTAWLAQHPNDVAVRFAYASALDLSGDTAAAVREYEGILATAPESAATLNNLAVIYQRQGDPKALATARKAYALAPKAPGIVDTLAWILIGAGTLDEGLTLLAPIAADSPDPNIRYHYAAGLAKAGRKAEAREIVKALVSGTPRFDSRPAAVALAKELE